MINETFKKAIIPPFVGTGACSSGPLDLTGYSGLSRGRRVAVDAAPSASVAHRLDAEPIEEEKAMSEVREEGLSALLHETRTFPPPEALAKRANAQPGIYDEAKADPLAFWASQAEHLTWATPWTELLDWSNAPFAKWFVGGRLNVAVNCVDRHVDAGLGDRVAFHWEGEPGDTRTITYRDLLASVSQAANALIELGVRTGDKVAIYMPMIPETVVAMLACARLGAPHTVVFGGFSSDALRGPHPRLRRPLRHHGRRRLPAWGGQPVEGGGRRSPRRVPRCGEGPRGAAHRSGRGLDRGPRRAGGTRWWIARPTTHEAEAFDAEHPLYIMYTSGTTAKPKGILHTSGGYLTHVSATHRLIFDIKPDEDVYWTAADIGWVTGHSYIVYGPSGQCDHLGHVRGHTRHAGPGPLVADHREVQGQHPLHRARPPSGRS